VPGQGRGLELAAGKGRSRTALRAEEQAVPRTIDAGGHGGEAAASQGRRHEWRTRQLLPGWEEASGAKMRSGGRDKVGDGLGAGSKEKKN
jgi:hypothetical protein